MNTDLTVAPTLTERLAALREGTSILSENKTPTPLHVFLYIYNRAGVECHIGNYIKAIKVLHDFLAPIEIPDIPDNLLPKHRAGIIHSGLLHDLAMAVRPTITNECITDTFKRHEKIKMIIVYLTAKDILK